DAVGRYGGSAVEDLNVFLSQWHDGRDYIEACTSGSTGRPKHVCLPKSDMRASARATIAFFGLDTASTVAMALSADFIAGKMMAVRAAECGARLLQLPVSNIVDLEGVEGDIDLLAIVPSQMQSFAARPHYASRVRNLLVGGAPPEADMCRRLTEAGYRVWISYGMTETCSHVALARGDDPERVFRAMPGVTFDTEVDGRLVIVAPAFSFGRLVANDVVELLSPTSFRWKSRADDVINSGGLKFFPDELEALYRTYLGDMEFCVYGAPDGKWGTVVALAVVGADADSVAAILRRGITDHRRLPKLIRTVEVLPRNANGKLCRRLLAQ
ncbi:MAG: AMP-binding protein, partial [Muribaculaceae bacterium]|nr:AMP-binding protein [Muribaculaceae bacterium]